MFIYEIRDFLGGFLEGSGVLECDSTTGLGFSDVSKEQCPCC